jgi:CRISPR-associated protein Cmr1
VPIFPFHLYLDSPAFIAGTDKNNPEMRSASIRGQLRYWLRALLGASQTNMEKLYEQEKAIFGATDVGSKLGIQVYPLVAVSGKVPMMPHRTEHQKQGWQYALSEEQHFELNIVTRPGVQLPNEALNALKIWSLLGGIGKRSRRMFGAVRILATAETKNDWYPHYNSPTDLADIIKDALKKTIRVGAIGGIPAFPTLHPDHSWVIVGKESFADGLEANRALFGLLRNNKFRQKSNTFGYAGREGRRASPLIAQVRQIDGEYYPILTAMRSRPDRNPTVDWTHLRDFMQTATHEFSAIQVWGGW